MHASLCPRTSRRLHPDQVSSSEARNSGRSPGGFGRTEGTCFRGHLDRESPAGISRMF